MNGFLNALTESTFIQYICWCTDNCKRPPMKSITLWRPSSSWMPQSFVGGIVRARVSGCWPPGGASATHSVWCRADGFRVDVFFLVLLRWKTHVGLPRNPADEDAVVYFAWWFCSVFCVLNKKIFEFIASKFTGDRLMQKYRILKRMQILWI